MCVQPYSSPSRRPGFVNSRSAVEEDLKNAAWRMTGPSEIKTLDYLKTFWLGSKTDWISDFTHCPHLSLKLICKNCWAHEELCTHVVFSYSLEWPTGNFSSSLKKTDIAYWNREHSLMWEMFGTSAISQDVCVCVSYLSQCWIWLPLHPQLSCCREQLTDSTCYLLWGSQILDGPSQSRPDLKLKVQYNFLLFTYSTFRSLGQVTFKNIKKEMSTGKGCGEGGSAHRNAQGCTVLRHVFKNLSANIRSAHIYRLEITAE